jgi:hypothetical protein
VAAPEHGIDPSAAIAVFVKPGVAHIAEYADLKIPSWPRLNESLPDEIVAR